MEPRFEEDGGSRWADWRGQRACRYVDENEFPTTSAIYPSGRASRARGGHRQIAERSCHHGPMRALAL